MIVSKVNGHICKDRFVWLKRCIFANLSDRRDTSTTFMMTQKTMKFFVVIRIEVKTRAKQLLLVHPEVFSFIAYEYLRKIIIVEVVMCT